jgi:hypothetical protein
LPTVLSEPDFFFKVQTVPIRVYDAANSRNPWNPNGVHTPAHGKLLGNPSASVTAHYKIARPIEEEKMQSYLVRSIKLFVLFLLVVLGLAQAQARPIQNNCGQTGGGLKQQDVKNFQGVDRGPIGVTLCDGSIFIGEISELNSDSFTVKTGKNQFVQINYTLVRLIEMPYAVGPSRSEKVGRQIEFYLFLPFRIVQCLIASCGS